MKTIAIAAVTLIASLGAASAQGYGGYNYGTGSNPQGHPVQGHTNSNGSYTQPHYQSNPNSTQLDNYGTRGNTNPFTGQTGTRSPRY